MEMEEDRISLLPDCVLGSIVSRLPVKNAAATMALSRRWRPLWPSLPLELDVGDHSPGAGRLISGALSSYGAAVPIRRFRADTLKDETTRPWLQALEGRRVDGSLVIRFAPGGPRPVLPPYILRASTGAGAGTCSALRRLELRWCTLHPRTTDGPANFPSLVVVHLSSLVIDDAWLDRLVASCPALRELRLVAIFELRRFVPRSGSLLRVTIGAPHVPIQEISFRGTPNLQSLELWHADIWRLYPAIIHEADIPCKLVGLALPTLDSPCFKCIMPKRPVPIITTLTLNMQFSDSEELRKAAHMLSLFPSLKTLHILCYNFFVSDKDKKSPGQWQLPADGTITCLNNKHLQNVILEEYCGSQGEEEFARFILSGAKALTTMQIVVHVANWRDQSISSHKDVICRGGKASPEVQVNFRESNKGENMLRKKYTAAQSVPIV